MSVKPNTAVTAANATTKDEKVITAEVPAQKTSDLPLLRDQVLADAVKAVQDKQSEGLTVTLSLGENGEVEIQVNETPTAGKVAKLVDGAKGVFKRNKKLLLVGAGLFATSVALRVIAARQEEDVTEDEATETPATDA